MKKIVEAVRPYKYKNNSNFKMAPYLAWKNAGGRVIDSRKLEKYYESISYHVDLPTIMHNDKVRLRFVEGACVRFDTFPDYICHEVIPVIWDCWPAHFDNMAFWFKKHKVKTAFFTSSQTADRMQDLFPNINVFHLPEAIETDKYKKGELLSKRVYDYLEFGRCCYYVNTKKISSKIKILSSRNEQGVLSDRNKLIEALSDSKITICIPRIDNQPEIAGNIETLTQRYWECMLSRILIIGRAPQELIDIIGYDPVIHLDKDNFDNQIAYIIENIDKYQELVDKNREMALIHGDWKIRIDFIRKTLLKLGYVI